MTADPGSIPIITTYFLYQAGYCETSSEIIAHRPTFERQVSEMVAAIERRPAVMLLELDAIGSSACMVGNGALPEWEADIRYEINQVSTLPHALIYIEGIINTADNGDGPLLNPHPVTQGNEDRCNPPARGAGIPTATDTGNPAIDAFMWVHVPGSSSGKCNGGTPAGTFWLARALTEARNANARSVPTSVPARSEGLTRPRVAAPAEPLR